MRLNFDFKTLVKIQYCDFHLKVPVSNEIGFFVDFNIRYRIFRFGLYWWNEAHSLRWFQSVDSRLKLLTLPCWVIPLWQIRKRSFSARIKMNFLFFGLFLVEFCSASKCRREKDRIKELSLQKRELRIERNELKKENEDLKRKLEAFEVKEEFEFFATKNSYFYVPVSKKRRKYEFTFSKRKF